MYEYHSPLYENRICRASDLAIIEKEIIFAAHNKQHTMLKKTFFTFIIFTFFVTAATAQRQRYNFNADWQITFADPDQQPEVEAQHVTLPHAWNEDFAFMVEIRQHPDKVIWYRKTFTLPASDAGKHVMVEFEGARQAAEVWINGHYLGLHENGVMAFGYDLTPYINYEGENVVKVRTDNDWTYRERATDTRFQWNNSNFNANYGGLPKNVWLHVTGDVYQTLPLYSCMGTTGTYIYGTDYDIKGRHVTVNAESQVINASDRAQRIALQVEVMDADGNLVGKYKGPAQLVAAGDTAIVRASRRLSGMHFWSWGYGYLYNVRTSLVVSGKVGDTVTTRTGFRKTRFAEGKIWLNDRVLMMHGYAQRTSNEWPAVGMSVPAWLSDYSNDLMVRSGGNLVRWMHVTPWKQDVESCDRVGLIQAMPAGDAEKDCQGRQWEQRCELMRDAIIYNRNNPSILFYEGGNESISREHMVELKQIRDLYDPQGGRAIGSREMLDIDEAEYGGEMLYINKSGKHPMWAMEYCRDEGYRQYWDNYSYPFHQEGAGPWYRKAPADIYNHNSDELAIEHIRRWYDYYVQRPGQGRRVSSGGVKIIFSDTNTHGRSEVSYRVSGVVDPMRIEKEGFYAAQVMWNSWVDIDYSRTHIMGHWNYPEGVKKNIYVVSTDPVVELFINDSLVARSTQAEYRFLHTFKDVTYVPSKIRAVGHADENDTSVTSEHSIETAGPADHLRLSLIQNPEGMVADGADMALVQVEVVDKEGRRCPTDNHLVHWKVEGPAEYRGGIAKSPDFDNYILSEVLPVECGVNRVLVRSTTKAGTIHVTASARGLGQTSDSNGEVAASSIIGPNPSGWSGNGASTNREWTSESISWQSRPVPNMVNAGLSTYIPGATLPCILDRGETPDGPSYVDRFETIGISSTHAGANAEEANKSFDDNELSEWKNDGRLSTAWITYTLDRPAAIDQISLKLTGWRQRSYPLEIYAGETLVWKGETPKSLGYVELEIEKPVEATTYTIRQVGSATDKEAFGQIVELAAPNAGELDLYKSADGDKVKGELRIVEVDFLKAN